ncbi:MAG: hypothetical protein ACRC4W_04470 [Treponemataceae bacterium]
MVPSFNESSLHKTLKKLYEIEKNGEKICYEPEKKVKNFRCDLLFENNIIEIQTANLSKLKEKIENLIDTHRITVVFPLVIEKTIITVDENDKKLASRKSPKKPLIYEIFNELTQIYPFVLHQNFTLEVLLIKTNEIRIKPSKEIVLPKRRSYRRRQNWIKLNKTLTSIEEKRIFKTDEDYLALLNELSLPAIFSSKDIKKTPAKNYANIMLWVLKRMNLIHLEKKDKKLCFYIQNHLSKK